MDYNLTQEQYSTDDVKLLLDKFIQSETDKVRTELYTGKIKPLETELASYKPAEKSDAEKQIDLKLAEISLKERKLAMREIGLPMEMLEFMKEDIDMASFAKSFITCTGYTPKNHKLGTDSVTKEKFSIMSYAERAKLYEQNPDLIKNLL